MAALMALLMPIFIPLLKLDPRPPHLPEGSSLVRALKPARAWLSLRYLQVLFGFLNQVIAVGVVAIAAISTIGRWGIAVALALGLVEVVVIAFALVAARVDFELRHYLVGDRSLRVSSGAFTRREVTVSYANVQNLEVTQGPIERLFGFKTLTLSTAGADASGQKGENLHVVKLAGLDNAEATRELMMGMMRAQHPGDSGLGDAHAVPMGSALSHPLLSEIKAAAVALRAAAER